MAIDQGRPTIEPWYDELIMWPEDCHVSPEHRARVLKQIVEAMIGLTSGIQTGGIVSAEVKLSLSSPGSSEHIGFEFSWSRENQVRSSERA